MMIYLEVTKVSSVAFVIPALFAKSVGVAILKPKVDNVTTSLSTGHDHSAPQKLVSIVGDANAWRIYPFSLLLIGAAFLGWDRGSDDDTTDPPGSSSLLEKQHWGLMTNGVVTVGSFIRLRKVQDSKMINSDLRCLVVYEKSSLTPLPNLTYEVVRLLEEHNNRLFRNEPINPDSGILSLEAGGDLSSTASPGNSVQRQPQSSRNVRPQQQWAPSQSPGTNRVAGNNGGLATSGSFSQLCAFMSAPISSTFEGNVRISGVFPALSSLSAHGL